MDGENESGQAHFQLPIDMMEDPLSRWSRQLSLWKPPKPRSPAGAADAWADLARWYAKLGNASSTLEPALISHLRAIGDQSSAVLDIGAGAGRLAVPLSKLFEQVIAVESSPSMLAALQRRVKLAEIANVEIVAGRWPDVVVPDVDVAFASNVVYDVGYLGPFLSKMHQVARVACLLELTPRHPLDAYRQLWVDLAGWTPPDGPTYMDAVECLRQLGVEAQIEIVSRQPSLVFRDAEEAAAFYGERLGVGEGSPAASDLLRLARSLSLPYAEGYWVPEWQFHETVILSWRPSKSA